MLTSAFGMAAMQVPLCFGDSMYGQSLGLYRNEQKKVAKYPKQFNKIKKSNKKVGKFISQNVTLGVILKVKLCFFKNEEHKVLQKKSLVRQKVEALFESRG